MKPIPGLPASSRPMYAVFYLARNGLWICNREISSRDLAELHARRIADNQKTHAVVIEKTPCIIADFEPICPVAAK